MIMAQAFGSCASFGMALRRGLYTLDKACIHSLRFRTLFAPHFQITFLLNTFLKIDV
jgi:hypothetical protein